MAPFSSVCSWLFTIKSLEKSFHVFPHTLVEVLNSATYLALDPCCCSATARKKYNHHAMYLLQNNNMNGNHSPHCHVCHHLQPSPRRPLTHCAPALPAISKGLHLNSRELHTYACSSISQQKRPAHASQLTFTRPSWRVSVSGCMVLHFNHHLAWQDPIPTVIIISSSLLFPRPKVVSEAVHVVMPV